MYKNCKDCGEPLDLMDMYYKIKGKCSSCGKANVAKRQGLIQSRITRGKAHPWEKWPLVYAYRNEAGFVDHEDRFNQTLPYDRSERGIYLIQSSGGGLVKIGVSDNFGNRLASIRAQRKDSTLNLVATTWGDQVMEAYLHTLFHKNRVEGEWFVPTQSLQHLIKSDTRWTIHNPLIFDREPPPVPTQSHPWVGRKLTIEYGNGTLTGVVTEVSEPDNWNDIYVRVVSETTSHWTTARHIVAGELPLAA